ncbi:MAG: LuxR C-terminal-related transcriptional regulator [Streptosporangiaceae bacterium]|jgi:LuxR family maltose regulon positive regulatory protein
MTTQVANQAAPRARWPTISSDAPILTSKITAPGVPDWVVPRPRIIELIAQGTRWCPLTIANGPAGAGKTMALVLWAASGPGPVAWVGLDEYDNEPEVFWSYVVAALRRSGVAVPGALPAATREAGHLFLLRLAAALAAQDPPVTLVLDDLHLLTDPQVLDGLDYVLRNTGARLRLVASARMDPPLPLHRYRLAGQLTEIRASDLAFTVAEARLLLARHGITLTADSLECLTRRTEGWAAGLRLAAISMGTHPDPDQFVTELITDNSALTGYLVAEVLDAQPPAARDVLLSTSILEQVSAQAASELTGNEQAAAILPAVAHANGFVQPTRSGWYRYHPLFAEVLRLKLSREYPDRRAALHRRAARWYERNGQLTDAVRHAAETGDWQLAASIAIDHLAIGEIIEPRGSPSLAGEFGRMPHGQAWTEPQPHLVSAATALSAGRHESSTAALDAAEAILERLPADQEVASRLAAAMIRLAASLRSGDRAAATAAAARAEVLASRVPGDTLARHPGIRARVLSGRGAVELWSGHLDEAADVLESGVAAATACGGEDEPADCLGYLALAEALRGRLRRAATVAGRATAALAAGQQRPPDPHPSPAALVALAWVHLEHYELREAHSRLTQADAALGADPDKLIAAAAWLAAAYGGLAEGRAAAAAQSVARARSGWAVPAWLDHKLSLVQSRAYATAGDIPAALAAAERAGSDTSVEATVTLAHAWATAGDTMNARRVLGPALAALSGEPDRVHLQARLVDARLSYTSGDPPRGRRSFTSALRLAEPEQLRLPFVLERSWIGPVLRRDPELAHAHQHLLAPTLRHDQLPAPRAAPEQAATMAAEPLSEREREVLRHVSRMLTTPEVASEMHISTHTVKTHVQNICRKLAVTRRGEAVRRARQLELI